MCRSLSKIHAHGVNNGWKNTTQWSRNFCATSIFAFFTFQAANMKIKRVNIFFVHYSRSVRNLNIANIKRSKIVQNLQAQNFLLTKNTHFYSNMKYCEYGNFCATFIFVNQEAFANLSTRKNDVQTLFIVTKICRARKLQSMFMSKRWHCANIYTCENIHVDSNLIQEKLYLFWQFLCLGLLILYIIPQTLRSVITPTLMNIERSQLNHS